MWLKFSEHSTFEGLLMYILPVVLSDFKIYLISVPENYKKKKWWINICYIQLYSQSYII